MYAQSLVEYGALSAAKTNVLTLTYAFRDWLAEVSPTTWVVVGGLIVAIVLFRGRRGR